MKVIKIQGISIQKQKQQAQKQSFPKRSLKVSKRKLVIESTIKRIERQSSENKNLNAQKKQSKQQTTFEQQNSLMKIKAIKVQLGEQQFIFTQNEQKSNFQSEIKLPFLTNTRISIISKKDIPIKQQKIELVDSILDKYRKEQRKTFYNNVILRNESKIQKQSALKAKKSQPIYKLIRIQPMRPSQKNSPSKHQFSMREVELNKIQRTCPLQRASDPNQTSTSIVKIEKATESKPRKKYSENLNVTQVAIRKERRVLSINKSNTQKKRNLSVSYLDFCLFISLTNKMQSATKEQTTTYKAYVGKGNNSILIKNTLKNRFWWNVIDSDNQINFLWTQHRQNKFLESLKSADQNQSKDQSTNLNKANKMHNFQLQIPQIQRSQYIKNCCPQGFFKLLSEQQRKKVCKNAYHCCIPVQQTFRRFQNPNRLRVHNHLQFNWNLTNKKALYYNMKSYYQAISEDPFEFIPLTFHVKKLGDEQWVKFQTNYMMKIEQLKAKKEKNKKDRQKNLWIIKPGENSNQGCGIDVADTIQEIQKIVQSKGLRPNGKQRSHIIQKYLMPFLYNKRKFDIRVYLLVTSLNRIVKAYWYEEGYIRTSSKQFTTKNLKSRFVHLTNDAVQKRSQQYGKFQNANKVSFNDFQKYLDNNFSGKELNFYQKVYPKMMKLAADTVKATYMILDEKNRQYSFEIFGLDFMIDEQFDTWLIQVNNNPCLQFSCPLLARIIPNMIDNAFRIAIDPIFPPPKDYPKNKNMQTQLFEANKFTLIFNSNEQGQNLKKLLKGVNLQGIVQSDEEEQGIQNQQN